MRNRKGFTLIELLVTIVVLAVVVLITVPTALNIMKSVRKKAFKSSVSNIIESAKIYYSKQTEEYEFNGEEFKTLAEIKNKTNIKTNKMKRGTLYITTDGDIKIYISDGEFCGYKDYITNEITITDSTDECGTEGFEMEITTTYNKQTTDTIALVANCTIPEGSDARVIKYEFSKDGGNTWNSKEYNHNYLNYYTYSRLNNNNNYQFMARCYSSVGTTKVQNINVNLKDIGKPTIVIDPGWKQEKNLTVNYPKGRYKYQFIDYKGNFLDNDWVNISTDNTDLEKNKYRKTYTSENDNNKIVIAKVLDESGNYIASDTLMITGIDRTPPTCGTYSGGSTTWTNGNRTISVTCNELGGSGCISSSFSNIFTTNKTTAGAGITIIDNVGNTKECNDTQNIYIDKTPPSVPNMNFVYGNWSQYQNNTWTNQTVYAGKDQASTTHAPTSIDNLSGINRYQISPNGGNNWYDFNYNSADSLYQISTDGTHTRTFRAVDNAGNVSATITLTAKIDKTPPSVPNMNFVYGNWSQYQNNTWTNQTVYAGKDQASTTHAPTSIDNLSGINRYQISPNGGNNWYDFNYNSADSLYQISTDGTHTRTFRAVDNAGNVSATITLTAKIDKTPPQLVYTWNDVNGYNVNDYDSVDRKIEVWVRYEDSGSGVQNIKYYYADDNGNQLSSDDPNGPFALKDVPSGGTNSYMETHDFWKANQARWIYFKAIDYAGNVSAVYNNPNNTSIKNYTYVNIAPSSPPKKTCTYTDQVGGVTAGNCSIMANGGIYRWTPDNVNSYTGIGKCQYNYVCN